MGTIFVVLLVIFAVVWSVETFSNTSKKEQQVELGTRRTYIELEEELMDKFYQSSNDLNSAYDRMCLEMRTSGYDIASRKDDFQVVCGHVYRRGTLYYGKDSSIVASRKSDYRRLSGDKYTREEMEKYVYDRPFPKNRFEYDAEFKRGIWLCRNIESPGQMVMSPQYGLCEIKSVSYWQEKTQTPIYTARQLSTGETVCFPYNTVSKAIPHT